METKLKKIEQTTFSPSYNSLMLLHEEYKSEFHNNLLFHLMQKGLLSNDKSKDIFFEYYQEFSNQFQKMILIRSALCEDKYFKPIFTQHLDEEYGHERLLEKERRVLGLKKDPIIQALCSWFPYKMFSSTPAEQLIISNLCIESAAVIIHTYAIPAFDPNRESNYYQVHEEHDCHHENMGRDLLKNLPAEQYERLLLILEEAWSMCNALMTRIAELIQNSEITTNSIYK